VALLGALVDIVVALIAGLGYPGLFLMMAAESMILPVPSEVVMPFAGFLVAAGAFGFWAVVAVALLGSLAGSLLSYAIGLYGGRPLVERYGRWFLIGPRELAWTDRFFARYGTWAVLGARFIPAVRHVISIPAGVARLPMRRFLPATVLGAGAWNTFLLWVGIELGADWRAFGQMLEPYELALLVLVAIGLALYVGWRWRDAHAATATPTEEP
jgi:membrane protein DedA with SNARE-associated domain